MLPETCPSCSVIMSRLNYSLSESLAFPLGSVVSKQFHFLVHFLLCMCIFCTVNIMSRDIIFCQWFSVWLTRTVAPELVQTLFYSKRGVSFSFSEKESWTGTILCAIRTILNRNLDCNLFRLREAA